MERILILGCAGCGKSTLAKTLGEKLDLPVYHLDVYFWQPNWVEADPVEFAEKQKELVSGDKWIIDGNYRKTIDIRLERCDTILYLDFPRLTALFGVIRRYFKYKNKERDTIGVGCKETIDKEFIKWIWHFKKNSKPKIFQSIVKYPNMNVKIFKSRHALNKYLKKL